MELSSQAAGQLTCALEFTDRTAGHDRRRTAASLRWTKKLSVNNVNCQLDLAERDDSTEAIAGILLDHDLSDSPFTESDLGLSTTNVLPLILRKVRKTVPVLIQSHNASKPPLMQRSRASAGFSVTRVRFATLSEERFHQWLDDVRDNWEPSDE